MKEPIQITVTGAAGQISYALLFRLASGALTGSDQPIILRLLEISDALPVLQGVVMELQDAAFPLLQQVIATDDAEMGFADADYAFLIGARPRSANMQRSDLLRANAPIFVRQGEALNTVAKPEVRVLIVGNPANTNALILSHYARDIAATQITAMTRLDHHRAIAQLALKTQRPITTVKNLIIWGNHSATQYPDLHHGTVDGKPALACVDASWYRETLIPQVQNRGTAIIQARGASSAASAAHAALMHMRDWIQGTPTGDYASMALYAGGQYDIHEGIYYSFPVQCRNGDYQVIKDLPCNAFSREKMRATEEELLRERDAIRDLLK